MINKSIAIVDDNPDLLKIYKEALMMSGYDVCSFSNPLAAYDHIKENLDKYSLLIINDKIPNVNGLFMATKLLEIQPKMNVIIMSDYFATLECNYKFNILKKHVSISKLIDVVNKSISKSILYNDKFYYNSL